MIGLARLGLRALAAKAIKLNSPCFFFFVFVFFFITVIIFFFFSITIFFLSSKQLIISN